MSWATQLSIVFLVISIALVFFGLIAIYQNVSGFLSLSLIFVGLVVGIIAVYARVQEMETVFLDRK